MLTKKQRDLLIYIHEKIAKGDVAPSFDEMKDALGLKSKSGIHRLINALVDRGFLERLPNKARALNVRRLPEGYEPQERDVTEAAQKARLVHNLKDYSVEQDRRLIVQVPLCGKIAAGSPIEAIQHEGQAIEIPSSLLGRGNITP